MEKKKSLAEPHRWLEMYGTLLFQYALPRVHDRETAEDLVQETFFSALKAVEGFKGESSEKNWLFSILKNKIIDHYRRRSASASVVSMNELSDIESDWFDADGSWNKAKTPVDWNPSANALEQKEIRRIILWCKDHLKLLQQQVFTLKYLEDLDSDEICKVLNISSSNYWVLLHRARLQMRECVEYSWLKYDQQ